MAEKEYRELGGFYHSEQAEKRKIQRRKELKETAEKVSKGAKEFGHGVSVAVKTLAKIPGALHEHYKQKDSHKPRGHVQKSK